MHNKLKIFCKKQTSVIFQPLIKKLRAKDARSLNGYLIISPKTGRSVIDNALRSANELAVLIYYARADVGAEGEQEQGDEHIAILSPAVLAQVGVLALYFYKRVILGFHIRLLKIKGGCPKPNSPPLFIMP